jgi:hypothetical protein
MQTVLKRSLWLAAAAILLQGGVARAASMEVKVPFPFLVHGHMLPAGQYRVEEEGTNLLLIRGEKKTHGEAFVTTIPATGHDPAGETPTLTFTQHETEHRLSGVWDSAYDGRVLLGR